MVTSTTTGEGKTFIASNLAVSLALLGKKIVIVGLDIRKPGLNKAFQLSRKEQGISQFLSLIHIYYYLQQNDVVYVTPNKTKAKNAGISNSTTIWFSVVGTLVSLVSLIVTIAK